MRRWAWTTGFAVGLFLFLRFCVAFVPGDAHPINRRGEEAKFATPGQLRIPVAGVAPSALIDTFTQAREQGARPHDAIDILAPRGTPVLAAADGRIEKLFVSVRGGNTIYERSTDGRWEYYYAHLDRYAPGLAEGQAVRRGAVIGSVGSTGNANPTAPHLHFAVNRMAPGDRWYQGISVNPYSSLR